VPKGPNGQKRPADAISRAVHVMRIATGEAKEAKPAPKSAAEETGSKGGKARAAAALVSTSYVEKHNQTMRQHMRRFTIPNSYKCGF
jgi:hypothetical protein